MAENILRNVKQRTDYAAPLQNITASSEKITIRSGTVIITKGTAATGIVLDDPDSRYDGLQLRIVSLTAAAHTVTNASGSGFNGSGASADVATFAVGVLNQISLVSASGVWYVTDNIAVTLA